MEDYFKVLSYVGDGLTDVVDRSDNQTNKKDNGGWVRIKIDMLMLYGGISKYNCSSQIGIQIIMCLFNGIMKSKFNGESTNKPNEMRRIYNDKPLDERDILSDIYPSKYNIDKANMDNDISNLRKKLWDFHNLNIFYRLVYNDTNIFFMERLFMCWKTYNPNGCVVPRTIKKIITLQEDIVNRIMAFEKAKGRQASRIKVEEAYMLFLMGMIEKMDVNVSQRLKKWTNGMDIQTYISDLSEQLEIMDDMEGLSYSNDFMLRLPATIRSKMEERIMNNTMMSFSDMEKDILPKQHNSVSVKKRLRKKRSTPNISVSSNDLGPEIKNFKDNSLIIKPFESPSQFYKFYKASVKLYIKANEIGVYPKFAPYSSECSIATEIMDTLKENRFEEKAFLKAWIESYCRANLKGKKAQNVENTSLQKFKKTFSDFKQSYYLPQ